MSTTTVPVTPFEPLEDHTELLGEELDRIRAEVVAARGAEDATS